MLKRREPGEIVRKAAHAGFVGEPLTVSLIGERDDNFTCFVDRNRLQGDGWTEEILDLEPLAEKLRAFRWHVQEIDGHDMAAILGAIDTAKGVRGQPQIILANTVKGKGVSFMEDVPQWHGTAPPTDRELATALAELGAEEAAT